MIRYLILGVFILMILIPTIILLFYYDNIKKNDLYMAFTAGTILNDTNYIKKIILTPTIKI